MHSNDAWEELNQKCAELEEEIIEKDKAIMDKNEEIKKVRFLGFIHIYCVLRCSNIKNI